MGEKSPQSTAELLSVIEREWKELWRVVNKLTPEQMTTPDAGGWSPKDNLAHLTEWMKILMGYHMDGVPAHEVIGVPAEVTRDWDFDVINPVLFERNRGRGLKEVVLELRQVYGELVTRLRSAPFDELLRPRFLGQPERGPLLNWVLSNTSEHFAEHRATIERAV